MFQLRDGELGRGHDTGGGGGPDARPGGVGGGHTTRRRLPASPWTGAWVPASTHATLGLPAPDFGQHELEHLGIARPRRPGGRQ